MVRSSDVYIPACVFSSRGPWPHTTSTLTPSHQLQLSVINLQRCVQGVMLNLWRCDTKLVMIPKFLFIKSIWSNTFWWPGLSPSSPFSDLKWDVCAFPQHFKLRCGFFFPRWCWWDEFLNWSISVFFFSTSDSLLYCTHLILRCSNVKPLNSFSILVAEALRHYLSPDLYLTYKRRNFGFRGGKNHFLHLCCQYSTESVNNH